MQTKQRPKLNIDLSPAGAIALSTRAWKQTPPRTRFYWLAGAFGLLILTLMFWRLAVSKTTTIAPKSLTSEMMLSTTTPAAMAGITPDTPQLEAIARLQAVLPRYEALMTELSGSHLDKMISAEAQRLYQQANKEISEGRYRGADPARDIDLFNCPVRMEKWRCVVFRYAGDAIAQVDQGTQTGDVYQVANGMVRFKAAMLALYPPPVETPDSAPTLQALINYRIGLYDLVRYLPNSTPMTGRFEPVAPTLSPAENATQANPLPGGQ